MANIDLYGPRKLPFSLLLNGQAVVTLYLNYIALLHSFQAWQMSSDFITDQT